jgi:enediyne biosynthesis protein E4
MNKSKSFLKKHITSMVAIVVITAIYLFARPPEISQKESIQLVNQFSFETFILPELAGDHSRSIREVHPQLTHISGWISAVGAAIAINDLDNDSYSNDVCYVDTRTDEVVVAPIPGTGSRFTPFALALPKAELGVGVAPMGCIPGDMNEDGLMDVLVYYWGRTPVAYLQKTTQSAGTLCAESFFAHPIGDASQRWHTNAATMADFDGDGHIDIAVGNYFPDDARVLDSSSSEKQTMHQSMTRAFNGGRNCFLRWKNATSGSTPSVNYELQDPLDNEVAQGWTLGLGAADLDGDLLPELYVSNDFGPDRLLHNRSHTGQIKFVVVNGRKTLSVPNSKVLGNDAFKGMGIDFGDINNDGHLDMYVSNIAAEWALQESHFMWVNTTHPEAMLKGEAPFVDESEPLGLARSSWGWESRLDDFNNDGILEAVQATGFLRGEVNRWPELHEVALSNDNLINLPKIWFRCKPGDDISGHDPNRFFVRSKSGRFFDIAQNLSG